MEKNYDTPNRMNQSRDLVLSINEFCFLQNKTNGSIPFSGPPYNDNFCTGSSCNIQSKEQRNLKKQL